MKINSIRWRLAFSYAAIALLAAVSLGLVLRTVLRGYYDNQEARYLQESAMRIGVIASQLMEKNIPVPLIQEQVSSWSFFLQARVHIEDASGRVIADSGVPDNKKVVFFTSAMPPPLSVGGSVSVPAGSPQSFQIQVVQEQAAAGGSGPRRDIVIFSPDSIGVAMPADVSMYGLFNFNGNEIIRRSSQAVAQRIVNERGVILGTLILSDGPAYGDEILNNVMNGLVAAGIVAVLLAAFAGWFFSNRITTPITALTHVTSRMAAGDLTARADVTGNDEMGTLGYSFNEMASRVEEMVGTLRSFVADAAHELHTPITALQTNLELARDEENVSALTLYLSRAQEQGQRLEALVKNLLDLSRIEASFAESNFNSVDISQIIREIAEQFASRAEQSNRALSLELPDEEISVLGNEVQLRQVFNNLLENALKFTRENDSINVSVENLQDEIIIVIRDGGVGISPEDLPHLFKRFHRGRNVSEFSGNGLGLAIVKAIVEGHGGEVDAASTGIGNGSEFTVRLPTRL